MAITTDRLAFYHIPRTGGTWVRRRLIRYDTKTPIGINHDEWKHQPPPDGVDLSERTSFTIVRDPEEWMLSWYWFLRMHEDSFRERIHPGWLLGGCSRQSFGAFVADYLAKMPGTVSCEMLAFIEGVDFVLRTDEVSSGLQELFNMVGMTQWNVTKDLKPHLGFNSTPEAQKQDAKQAWRAEQRAEFRESERQLYERMDNLKPALGQWLYKGGRVRETVCV